MGLLANLKDKISRFRRRTHRDIQNLIDTPDAAQDTSEVAIMDKMWGGLFDLITDQDGVSEVESNKASYNSFLFDGRVRSAVTKIAEKACFRPDGIRPFKIKVQRFGERQPRVEKTLDLFFDRIGIYTDIECYLRSALLEGTSYYRVILSETREILGLEKIKVTKPLTRIIKLGDDIEEEDFRGGYLVWDVSSQKPVGVYYWWELIPFSWNYDDELGRGVPLIGLYKKHIERLDRSERSLAIARWTRSFKRLAFKVRADTPDQFREFIRVHEELKKRYGGDEEIFSDVYTTDDVKSLDESSAALWNIDDVQYLEKNIIDGLGVPHALYGSGGKEVPNRAVLDVIYNEWLMSQIMNAHQTLTGKPFYSGLLALVTLFMLLKGRHPEFTKVKLVWPAKHLLDDVQLKALLEAYDRGLLSKETFLRYLLKLDYEDELMRQGMDSGGDDIIEQAVRISSGVQNGKSVSV